MSKTKRVMDSSIISDFTEGDFLELAFECIDQAMVDLSTQRAIRKLLLERFDGAIMMEIVHVDNLDYPEE